MNLFFPLKKGMSHQQWRQKVQTTPHPQNKTEKNKNKKEREREREKEGGGGEGGRETEHEQTWSIKWVTSNKEIEFRDKFVSVTLFLLSLKVTSQWQGSSVASQSLKCSWEMSKWMRGHCGFSFYLGFLHILGLWFWILFTQWLFRPEQQRWKDAWLSSTRWALLR